MTQYKSAFTVDVECGISLAMRDSYGIDIKPTDRVVINTNKILELLDEKNITGTFFALGIVAEVFPDLIRRISSMGHELGVHGYHHYKFSQLSKDQAFQELDRAKKLIEDLSGKQVFGHRAPAFSIDHTTKWSLDIIKKVGFMYDSSIAPIQSKLYGWSGFDDKIQNLKTPNGSAIIEVPIKPEKFIFWEILFPGGRYFQILPYFLTKKKLSNIVNNGPAIFYMHPYEIDTTRYPDYYYDQLQKAGLKKNISTRLRWFRRGSYIKKLEKLITDFQFTSIIEILKEKKMINESISINETKEVKK